MTIEESKIVFGSPNNPSTELLIKQLPKKEQKKIRRFTPCLFQSGVNLGFRWICTLKKGHKPAHNKIRIPRIVDPPHPERKSETRLFD